MGKAIEVSEALWTRLSDAAKRARRTPETLLRGLIREFLEIEADRDQDEALRRVVKVSGYKERDAVRLVREYRSRVASRFAGRVSDHPSGYRRSRDK